MSELDSIFAQFDESKKGEEKETVKEKPVPETAETVKEPETKPEITPKSPTKSQSDKAAEILKAKAIKDPSITPDQIAKKTEELAGLITPEGAKALLEQESGVKTPKMTVPDMPSGVAQQTAIQEFVGKPKIVVDPSEFDMSDAKPNPIITLAIFGDKADGKSEAAMSLLGSQYWLSFDEKAIPVWMEEFNSDPRIKIKDATRYLSKITGEDWLQSAEVSGRYIEHLLLADATKFLPDWIVVDGLDIFIRDVCEMRMRYNRNLDPIKPFNLMFWKERNLMANNINLVASKIAKRGIIYTAYAINEEETITYGTIVTKKKKPRWAGDIEKKVDVVIRVERKETKDTIKFYATIESSKVKGAKTGDKKEIPWDSKKQDGGLRLITNFEVEKK